MKPLVAVEDEQPEEEKPVSTTDATIEQMAEKTQTVKSVLGGVANWLANRKLPPSVKQGLRDEWEEVWTGKHQSKRGKKKKYMSSPFKSFSKNQKKGKL